MFFFPKGFRYLVRVPLSAILQYDVTSILSLHDVFQGTHNICARANKYDSSIWMFSHVVVF